MKKTETTPLWVFLAFYSIESRKGALMLMWSSLVFSLYCIPWANYFNVDGRVAKLFLVNDWIWFCHDAGDNSLVLDKPEMDRQKW
jgi:hypothetical protein